MNAPVLAIAGGPSFGTPRKYPCFEPVDQAETLRRRTRLAMLASITFHVLLLGWIMLALKPGQASTPITEITLVVAGDFDGSPAPAAPAAPAAAANSGERSRSTSACEAANELEEERDEADHAEARGSSDAGSRDARDGRRRCVRRSRDGRRRGPRGPDQAAHGGHGARYRGSTVCDARGCAGGFIRRRARRGSVPRDVLDRTQPDLLAPLTASARTESSPYLAHPWLSAFVSGPVARFEPDVDGVERWRLLVADSHGQVAANFSGQGRPPREIEWGGRTDAGTLVTPGLTYSYVSEAYDRAGNKRNIVGQGFTVPAYRIDTPSGPVLTFGGASTIADAATAPGQPTGARPAILIEAASWMDRCDRLSQPIRVTATARTMDAAQALADRVTANLGPMLVGDPARLRPVTHIQTDAPEGGTVMIAPEGVALPRR